MSLDTPAAGITRMPFGALPDGREVELYLLTNDSGTQVSITTHGAPDHDDLQPFCRMTLG